MTTIAKSGTPHVRIASTASSRADSITTFGRHTGFASLTEQAHKLENANSSNKDASQRVNEGSSGGRTEGLQSRKQSIPRKNKTSTSAASVEGESRWGANFWVTLVEPQVRFRLLFLGITLMHDTHITLSVMI